MGERSDQITRKIERTRGELGANLNELENKMRDVTDWRKHVEKNPLTMIGIAFGGGVLLSQVFGGPSRTRRHYRPRNVRDGEVRSSTASAAPDTWGKIKGALVGVAAGKVEDFLRTAVPGFHEQYAKVGRHSGPERLGEPVSHTPGNTPQNL
jgi:hypothetical protein